MKIKLIVVEDNDLVRKGIIGLLNEQDDLQVVGEANNGSEAIKLLDQGLESDIVLTDFNMPGIIILTMHQRAEFVDRARSAGASGYMLKDGNFDELFAGIRSVYTGEKFVTVGL